METSFRRLGPADAAEFQALRMEGFVLHPLEFRIAPEDEARVKSTEVAERLGRDFVVGGYRDGVLAGIGGLTQETRAKLRHKALLWGMYVRAGARGTGIADGIVERLLDHARAARISVVLLTVMAGNGPAQRLYERWGFATYGTEPRAVRIDGRDFAETLMARQLD
jgi:ribosomal protein S18 acetylase RimI-like enzyme